MKEASIGEIRHFGKYDYVKTIQGWKPYNSKAKDVPSDEDFDEEDNSVEVDGNGDVWTDTFTDKPIESSSMQALERISVMPSIVNPQKTKSNNKYDRAIEDARRIQSGEITVQGYGDADIETARLGQGGTPYLLEASCLLGNNIGSKSKTSKSSEGSTEKEIFKWDKSKLKDISTKIEQEKLLEIYAQRRGIWFDQDYFDNLQYYYGRDNSDTYIDPNNASQYIKVTCLTNYEEDITPMTFLDKIVLWNFLFPETAYNVIGFTKTAINSDEEQFAFVTTQPFVQGDTFSDFKEQLFEEDENIDVGAFNNYSNRLIRNALRQQTGMDDWKYAGGNDYYNDRFDLDDLNFDNIIVSADSKLYFIDGDLSLIESGNKKEDEK